MIPLPQIVSELVLGIGFAFFAGNLWALLSPAIARARGLEPEREVPNKRRVIVNVVIGALVAAWGLATLLRR